MEGGFGVQHQLSPPLLPQPPPLLWGFTWDRGGHHPPVGCWGSPLGGPRVGDGAEPPGLNPTEGILGGTTSSTPPFPAAPQPSPCKEKEARGRQAGTGSAGSRGPPRGSLQSESSSSSEAEAPYPCPEIQRLREAAGIALRHDKQPPAPRRCEANHKGEGGGSLWGCPCRPPPIF